jgi:hypothetical protein
VIFWIEVGEGKGWKIRELSYVEMDVGAMMEKDLKTSGFLK